MGADRGSAMAWFKRAQPPEPDGQPRPDEATTDTVGNPIVQRRGRHVAEPEPQGDQPGPSRAEHRMLQFVAEGRVARSATGGAGAEFWRLDGAFAVGTKAMMLDWLLEQSYLELGKRTRVTRPAVLTERGREVLLHPF